jgi:hypothetical protein
MAALPITVRRRGCVKGDVRKRGNAWQLAIYVGLDHRNGNCGDVMNLAGPRV